MATTLLCVLWTVPGLKRLNNNILRSQCPLRNISEGIFPEPRPLTILTVRDYFAPWGIGMSSFEKEERPPHVVV